MCFAAPMLVRRRYPTKIAIDRSATRLCASNKQSWIASKQSANCLRVKVSLMISSTISALELFPTVIAFVSFCVGLLGLRATLEDLAALRDVRMDDERRIIAADNLRNIVYRIIIKLALIGNGIYVMILPPAVRAAPVPPAVWGYATTTVVTSVMLMLGTISDLQARRTLLRRTERRGSVTDRRGAAPTQDVTYLLMRQAVRDELAARQDENGGGHDMADLPPDREAADSQ